MLQLLDIHAPIFGLPFVVGRSTYSVFSANICDRHPRLTFFEDFDDLAFAVPALFHVWLLFYQLCLLIAGTILGEPYRVTCGHNGRCDTLWTESSLSVEQDVAGSTPVSHP